MGWINDKGTSTVQSFKKGGKVKSLQKKMDKETLDDIQAKIGEKRIYTTDVTEQRKKAKRKKRAEKYSKKK